MHAKRLGQKFYRQSNSKKENHHIQKNVVEKIIATIGTYQNEDTESKAASQRLYDSFKRLNRTLNDTVNALSAAVEARDPYTSGHMKRVAELSKAISLKIGLSESQSNGIYDAGMLHDLGKIQIPSEILAKPGRLNKAEFELIKYHSKAGYEILKHIEYEWPIANVAHQHHEKLDGAGYPQALKGEAICLEARIIAVADVVESIQSNRPYRPALGVDVALGEISTHKGNFYDPMVVDACIVIINEGSFSFDLSKMVVSKTQE